MVLGSGVYFWSYPRSSVVDLGLFGFVLASLLVQRRGVVREDDTELGTFVAAHQARPLAPALAALPEIRAARTAGVALLAVAGAALSLWLSDSQLIVLAYMAIYGIVAISLVVLTGWAGEISLGQFAFVAVGAAVTGGLYVNAGVDLFVGLLLAVVIGGATAVVIGAPALRLPGLLAAVATLAFAVPVSTWLVNPENFPALTPADIPRPKLFGWLALSSPRTFAVVCLIVAAPRPGRSSRACGTPARSGDPWRARQRAGGRRHTASTRCEPGSSRSAWRAGCAGWPAASMRWRRGGVGFAGFNPSESHPGC